MSAAVAIDRGQLRAVLQAAIASGDLERDTAEDLLAAFDAGAFEPVRLPDAVRRRLERAAATEPGSDSWDAALLALVPVALAVFPGPGTRWSWDAAEARYVTAGGRVLHPAILTREVNRTIARARATVPTPPATPEPKRAEISGERRAELARWQAATEEELFARHTAMAAAGRGGLDQLTDADREWVRERALSEFARLDRFRGELAEAEAAGRPKSEAYIRNRLGLYTEKTRGTFAEMQGRAHLAAGYTEQRNVEAADAEHCEGCPRETRREWHATGTGVRICERDCGPNDQCRYEYRRPAAVAPARGAV